MSREQSEKVLFSWIHLSDVHFLHGTKRSQVDQEMILNALIQDIRNSSSSLELGIPNPDVIFVTGDIAYSGAEQQPDEYVLAEKWLKKIAASVKLSPGDVFVVPGNHDVQRTVVNENDDVSMLIESLRDGKRDLDWALAIEKQHKRLMIRFDSYLKFASAFAPLCMKESNATKSLFWKETINAGSGFAIKIMGLNTAMLSQDDEDQGKLRMSLTQFKDFPDFQPGDNQMAIALGHHPFSWLADGDTTESWLRKKVHIYLSGHIHISESISYRSGGGTGLVRIQAGAVHTHADSPSAYNFAAVVANSVGQLTIKVWNRIWSVKNKDFRADIECHPVGQLFAEHPLSMSKVPVILTTDGEQSEITAGLIVKVEEFERKNEFITDSPPVVDVWVGREHELSAMQRIQSGVVVITGIGGQGKSALASKYLEDWNQSNKSFFWDWRDCREQREQFHTKLVSIIEHFTVGRLSGNSLEGAKTKDLVRLFFETASNHKGLIILDNMDHYVDVAKRSFMLGVSDLVDGALKYANNLLVILTCRPRINYASPRFHEIHLEGISVPDAEKLFSIRGVDCGNGDSSGIVRRIHSLTNGHPLWLNLIATQVAMKLATIDSIINDLEQGQVDDRAKTMMRTVWKGLNHRQEVVLRSMAELSKPMNIEWIHECVKKEIKSWNQFRRTFESMQSLSLVIKSRGAQEFDLHPIVRNFIRTEFYTKCEREPFLDSIILVVKAFISKSRKSISLYTPINLLEHFVLKAELEMRKDDLRAAIATLVDVGEKLVQRGMPGELFRIGEDLLSKCKENHENLMDYDKFHSLNVLLANTYAEYGRKVEAKKQLEAYANLVPDQTAQFISVCDTRCYVEWILGNHEEAIFWGSEGVRFKKASGIDTKFDSSHHLALAQRDFGCVDEALSYFLEGNTIENVLSMDIKKVEKNAPFFGNIGRCLHLQGKLDEALSCVVKSALLLEKGSSALEILNQGYAALWIGEILEKKDDDVNAIIFYRQAEMIWSERAPIKVYEPRDRLANILNRNQNIQVPNISQTGINRVCKKWIESYMQSWSATI